MVLCVANTVAPPWVVLPLGCFALIFIGMHLQWMQQASMPDSRRRIRTATNLVSMITVPLIAAGFGVISPDNHRLFVLVWLGVIGLLGVIVILAGIDMGNNMMLHLAQRRHIRKKMRKLHTELRQAVRQHNDR